MENVSGGTSLSTVSNPFSLRFPRRSWLPGSRVVPEQCSGVRKRCSVFDVRFGFPNAFGLNNVFGLNGVRFFVRVLSVRCSCSRYCIFVRVRVHVRHLVPHMIVFVFVFDHGC